MHHQYITSTPRARRAPPAPSFCVRLRRILSPRALSAAFVVAALARARLHLRLRTRRVPDDSPEDKLPGDKAYTCAHGAQMSKRNTEPQCVVLCVV